VLAHDVNTARRAREHNDANVFALGGRIVTGEAAIAMVQVFPDHRLPWRTPPTPP